MNLVILSFMAFSGGARSANEKTFEEKVQHGYELLKNHQRINETRDLVLQLRKMAKEVEDRVNLPKEDDPEMLDEIEDDVEIDEELRKESIEEINQRSNVAATLYQGDMIVNEEQADEILKGINYNKSNRNKRQAIRDRYHNATWKHGVYYYYYNASITTRRLFGKAVHAWQSDTCIDFFENEKAPDRIAVIEEEGCWSEIGKIGGEQGLSLGPGCEEMRNALQELGHALGFYHTHTRYDRDHFVKLYARNLGTEWVPAFVKENKSTNRNFYVPNDYGSVMHYGARGASKNRKPVMIPYDKNYLYTMGSPMISFYDKLLRICSMDAYKGPSAECENGGFPHPRNCFKCICPSGYAGRLCQRRPNGCGGYLTASEFFVRLCGEVGRKDDYRIRDVFRMCHYWIVAPLGSKIEVVFESFEGRVDADGCPYAGVEIKTGSDKRQTGYRLCPKRQCGMTLTSTHNIVPIITYSNTFSVTACLLYRIAPSGSPKKCKTTPRLTPAAFVEKAIYAQKFWNGTSATLPSTARLS